MIAPSCKFSKILIVTLFATFIIIYLYLIHETNETRTELTCPFELKSVKYQLNVVTEYKNKIDKLLTEKQFAHHGDKAKLHDTIENCMAMKQQASLCQSQFEDLQMESKILREDYDKLYKELEKLKTGR